MRKLLLFLLVSLCCWLCSSSCEASQIVMSTEDLTILESTLEISETALRESIVELKAAKTSLEESAQELEDLTIALSESEEACKELKMEIARLKAESARLSSELVTLKVMSMKASTDLKEAERLLNDTEAKYKSEKKKNKRETRIWQIVSVVLAGIAVSR